DTGVRFAFLPFRASLPRAWETHRPILPCLRYKTFLRVLCSVRGDFETAAPESRVSAVPHEFIDPNRPLAVRSAPLRRRDDGQRHRSGPAASREPGPVRVLRP